MVVPSHSTVSTMRGDRFDSKEGAFFSSITHQMQHCNMNYRISRDRLPNLPIRRRLLCCVNDHLPRPAHPAGHRYPPHNPTRTRRDTARPRDPRTNPAYNPIGLASEYVTAAYARLQTHNHRPSKTKPQPPDDTRRSLGPRGRHHITSLADATQRADNHRTPAAMG